MVKIFIHNIKEYNRLEACFKNEAGFSIILGSLKISSKFFLKPPPTKKATANTVATKKSNLNKL